MSLVEMESAMISIAPTMHAYLSFCSHLEIGLFSSLDWHWLLPPLSRYDPLYIRETSNLFWTMPTLPEITSPSVSIQLGPDIDLGHFRDIVWDMDSSSEIQGRLDDWQFLAASFLSNLRDLVSLRRQLDAGEDSAEEEFADCAQRLHRLEYTLRFLGPNAECDYIGGFGNLTPSALTEVASSYSSLKLDHFTITTLLRLSRSQLSGSEAIWGFLNPVQLSSMATFEGIQRLNITYSRGGRPNLREFVHGILSVETYRLPREGSFEWDIMTHDSSPPPAKTKIDLHSDFLYGMITAPVFGRNSSISGNPFFAQKTNLSGESYKVVMRVHRAVGRLIALCLRDPTLRHLLRPYWIVTSQPTTILETIFFGSHMVREGVHDILPLGVLENMFPNANALVDSLPHPL